MKMQPPVKRDFDAIRSTENQPKIIPSTIPAKKDGRGRPPVVFTETMLQEILAAYQLGWSDEKVAAHVHISHNTMYKYFRANPLFLKDVQLAKSHQLMLAGNAINEILGDKANKDRGPMARFIYTKRIPETYGDAKIPQGTQNNFLIITNEQLKAIVDGRSAVSTSSPSELFENLKSQPAVDISGEEGSAAPIYQGDIQGEYTEPSSLPDTPGAI